MLILVHGNGFELDPSLRRHVQSKIESSLSRFQNRIGSINAYLADLNGPKNGIDKSIKLVIDLEKKPVVVLDEKGGQWHTLLESISDRASHTISRVMSKSRQRRKHQ